MIFNEFVQKAVSFFQKQKKEKIRIKNRLIRGRALSISSTLEDLIAEHIESIINKKYLILIDYPISYNSNSKRKKTIYPDIILIDKDDNKIIEIIEIKTDLGYLSDDWSKYSENIFAELKQSGKASYKTNVGTAKNEIKELNVNKDIGRQIIVLTSKNDHGKMEEFRNNNSNCYVLMQEHHPNDFNIDSKNKKKFINDIIKSKSDWIIMTNYFTKYK